MERSQTQVGRQAGRPHSLGHIFELEGLSPQRHIFYCQSGVRTTTAIFALYLMGWDPAHLINYPGSWIEWSRDPANPIQRDP